jgi:hypothetical protein
MSSDASLSPEAVAGLLAEPDRLGAFAALVLGARTAAEVATASGLEPRAVGRALQRLADGGLIEQTGQGYRPVPDVFKDIARTAAPPVKATDHGYADQRIEAVLRSFVRDGKLVGMPAQAGRRQLLLEHIVQSFEPGRTYPETDVNAVLRAWTEGGPSDHVTLRRYLVDAGLLTRDGGDYWRSGGWVDVLD